LPPRADLSAAAAADRAVLSPAGANNSPKPFFAAVVGQEATASPVAALSWAAVVVKFSFEEILR
jgi:hypothetical protein